MIDNDLLMKLISKQVELFGSEKKLTDEEKERILGVFRKAMADPFMVEWQIYRELTGDEAVPATTIYD